MAFLLASLSHHSDHMRCLVGKQQAPDNTKLHFFYLVAQLMSLVRAASLYGSCAVDRLISVHCFLIYIVLFFFPASFSALPMPTLIRGLRFRMATTKQVIIKRYASC